LQSFVRVGNITLWSRCRVSGERPSGKDRMKRIKSDRKK
jgi:hypothetical protein